MSIMLTESEVRDIDSALSYATGGEGQVYFGYSGRGMYGATCFGVSLDRSSDLLAFGVELACSNPELAKALGDMRTDDLGLGIIAYWPDHDAECIEQMC